MGRAANQSVEITVRKPAAVNQEKGENQKTALSKSLLNKWLRWLLCKLDVSPRVETEVRNAAYRAGIGLSETAVAFERGEQPAVRRLGHFHQAACSA
jgi:hypothetical protein